MNYLAHLVLAGDSAESLIGNLAGDFVKGPLHERFEPAIRAGILEHRRIDSFTDSHAAVAAFRGVLFSGHGHYARVIADVFFDHFLAVAFEELTGEPLETWLDRAWSKIDTRLDALPGHLATVYPMMRDQRWLLSYATAEGIHRTLERLSHRLSRKPHLEAATHYLIDSRIELERLFRAFWPEVVGYAKALRKRPE